MTLDQLREEVVAVTRRTREGLDDPQLARRVAAARITVGCDTDDPLAPARGVLAAVGISVTLVTLAVLAIGAVA